MSKVVHIANGRLNNTVTGRNTMAKFLILGKNGQVGWELQRTLALRGEVLCLGRHDEGGDLSSPEKVATAILDFAPDAVFNAAAYTAVDKAETESEEAYLINAQALQPVACACKKVGALLIHYSTDYVFDGSGQTPRIEDAIPSPVNVYGASKLAGEKVIGDSGCSSLIFRTSWVYGVHGKNFIKTILRLGQTKESLKVVNDQIGAPTSAEFIADVSTALAMRVLSGEKSLLGTYHLVPNGETNWCDFAKWIISNARELNYPLTLSVQNIKGIPSEEYPTPAKRPLNSRLDNNKLKGLFPKQSIHSWDTYAKRVLTELARV